MPTMTMPSMKDVQANLQQISDQYTEFVKQAQDRFSTYTPELPSFLSDLPSGQELLEQAVAFGRKVVDQQVTFVRNLVEPVIARFESSPTKVSAVVTATVAPATKVAATPAAKKPVAKKTAAKKPVAKKTAAKKPAAKKAATRKAASA
jgi:hypothetical protein